MLPNEKLSKDEHIYKNLSSKIMIVVSVMFLTVKKEFFI